MLDWKDRETAVAVGMPVAAQTECRVFLRRDIETGRPKEAVAWVVWHGGFAELHTWPWDEQGLGMAGFWAVEHEAVDHAGFPIRDRDHFMCHVGAV